MTKKASAFFMLFPCGHVSMKISVAIALAISYVRGQKNRASLEQCHAHEPFLVCISGNISDM